MNCFITIAPKKAWIVSPVVLPALPHLCVTITKPAKGVSSSVLWLASFIVNWEYRKLKAGSSFNNVYSLLRSTIVEFLTSTVPFTLCGKKAFRNRKVRCFSGKKTLFIEKVQAFSIKLLLIILLSILTGRYLSWWQASFRNQKLKATWCRCSGCIYYQIFRYLLSRQFLVYEHDGMP